MSAPAERVRGWFVAPRASTAAPLAVARPHLAALGDAVAAAGGRPGIPPAPRAARAAPALVLVDAEPGTVAPPAAVGCRSSRVCVLGTGASALALGGLLAQRLARLPGAHAAVLRTWSPAAGAGAQGRGGPPAAAARRLATALRAAGHAATARGRLVQIALPDAALAAQEACRQLDVAAPSERTVTVLAGPRDAALDAVLATQDLVLVEVAAGAPDVLGALAVASVQAVAPGAAVRAICLPTRLAGPARRAVVARALEGLG